MTHRNILIIEDNAEIRDTLRDVFELEGYGVRTAENGAVGLCIAREPTAPCLILLDLMMPVMDGWQFLQTMKATVDGTLTKIPVVVVSGVADHAEVADLKNRYGCDVISKPADIDCLLRLAATFCSTRQCNANASAP